MDTQQNFEPELLIDGYISRMFGPQAAQAYYVSLLGIEPQHVQHYTAIPESPGIFFATPPPVIGSDQQSWAIDYVIRDTGPVIPQQIWAPRITTNTNATSAMNNYVPQSSSHIRTGEVLACL